jgi:hypothetical protein
MHPCAHRHQPQQKQDQHVQQQLHHACLPAAQRSVYIASSVEALIAELLLLGT